MDILARMARPEAQPWLISGLIHGVIVLGILVMLFYKPRFETVSISVVEAPVVSPAAVPQIMKPKPKPIAKPKERAVFGASRKSITDDVRGVQTKQGNTVAKAPDNEKLRADDKDALPIPEDEYLVSEMPRLLSEIRIPYPEEAKKKQVQGAVVMELLIDAEGRVRETSFIEGPGFGLNEAAMNAIKGFKFSPARIQDKSVAVKIRYAYRFVLER